MKKKADEFLYNEALKYLGKYPATKKKISEILEKRLKNKKGTRNRTRAYYEFTFRLEL